MRHGCQHIVGQPTDDARRTDATPRFVPPKTPLPIAPGKVWCPPPPWDPPFSGAFFLRTVTKTKLGRPRTSGRPMLLVESRSNPCLTIAITLLLLWNTPTSGIGSRLVKEDDSMQQNAATQADLSAYPAGSQTKPAAARRNLASCRQVGDPARALAKLSRQKPTHWSQLADRLDNSFYSAVDVHSKRPGCVIVTGMGKAGSRRTKDRGDPCIDRHPCPFPAPGRGDPRRFGADPSRRHRADPFTEWRDGRGRADLAAPGGKSFADDCDHRPRTEFARRGSDGHDRSGPHRRGMPAGPCAIDQYHGDDGRRRRTRPCRQPATWISARKILPGSIPVAASVAN